MSHVLAIHAHPDDIETLAAGTLALLAASGHRITIATITAGDCGSAKTGLEETAAIRKREAQEAARVIGAGYACVGLPDLGVFNNDTSRRKTVETIRATAPDLVITASPADYHPDHEATSVLVRDACFAASVPNYRTGPSAVLNAIPSLYFMDPIEGRDRDGKKVMPDFAADVSETFATKALMLSKHASQLSWVGQQHGIDDMTASMEAWTRKRGRDYGVVYAEGFRQYVGVPYPRAQLLQESLGSRLLLAP